MAKRGSYRRSGPLGELGLYPYSLENQAQAFTVAEARAEYARLRREANRRLDVLSRSEFSGSRILKNYSTFEALERGAEERDVRKDLYDVARFLSLKTSSLTGARRARKAQVESLQEAGYDFVNISNVEEFGRFMGEVQRNKASRGYDSEQIVELFHAAKRKRIDTQSLARDFEFWIGHFGELEEAPRSQSTTTSEAFAERIGLEIPDDL